jgi:hypothetical protein
LYWYSNFLNLQTLAPYSNLSTDITTGGLFHLRKTMLIVHCMYVVLVILSDLTSFSTVLNESATLTSWPEWMLTVIVWTVLAMKLIRTSTYPGLIHLGKILFWQILQYSKLREPLALSANILADSLLIYISWHCNIHRRALPS